MGIRTLRNGQTLSSLSPFYSFHVFLCYIQKSFYTYVRVVAQRIGLRHSNWGFLKFLIAVASAACWPVAVAVTLTAAVFR